MAEVKSAADVDALFAGRASNRLLYWFDIPKGMQAGLGIQKIAIVELLAAEQLAATDRSESNVGMGFEMAKESLRMVDDKKLMAADGSIDAFWSQDKPGMSAFRNLVIAAFGQIHNPKAVDLSDFLSSQTVAAQ